MGILDKFKKGSEEEADEVKSTEAPKAAQPASAKKDPAKVVATAKTEKKSESEETVKPIEVKKHITGILVKPLITEKAAMLGGFNQYAFEVTANANKIQIAHAIESKYGAKPIKVNIIKKIGKNVRYGKSFGRTRSRKKAIVSLPEGKSIRIHEGT